MASEERVGVVSHYYSRISVAVIDLRKDLQQDDRIHFMGTQTDFQQRVESMQVEHEQVEQAHAGTQIAVRVKQRVRRNDFVYRLVEQG